MREVRKVLAQYPGKHVDILIDSFGGSLPEGLSICGAFRDHGDVTVHFRGMNASAATLASMGAKRILIAPESMYLIHKVSMGFFDWASRNSDQLDEFIKALQSTKDDLDTMDRSIAELYASRCNKPVKDLLSLMKAEKWITAADAREWGFVDDITESSAQTEAKPTITRAQAMAFESLGLPLPPVAVEPEAKSLIQSIIDPIVSAIKSINKQKDMETTPVPQAAVQTPAAPVAVDAENASSPVAVPVENAVVATAENSVSNQDLAAENARLRAELEAYRRVTPGATTNNVVVTPTVSEAAAPKNAFEKFVETSNSARKLFDSIP